MPIKKCPNGKYRIGSGPCMYKSKKKATRAYRAYLAKHPRADNVSYLPGQLIDLTGLSDIEAMAILAAVEPPEDPQ